jgi:GIY-YIG catalytic domain
MLSFATLIREADLAPSDVRLLRHQDTRYPDFPSPYIMWRDERQRFETYQQTQSFGNATVLDAKYWASFVGLPNRETLFVGLYRVASCRPLPDNRSHPVDGSLELAGSCNLYELELSPELEELTGRLLIEWGAGYRSWIQRADRQAKPIIELRREFSEPAFPGFSAFICKLSEIDTLPLGWLSAFGSTRGIYLLTCPKTKEQYVGSASGSKGFLGRWRDYAASGHGGNAGLKSRDASDYQISILETVGSGTTEAEVLKLEALWKDKLQSREMGLNRN